ncbi:LysR family transcriptional regulator [Facklamia languida]|uniref:HTH lysR-type domain-containing protein n=1 Tax=Facklamia languida CCUG 37842 TaxID=883113 RepID=H3NJA9_9LACT|nr:LysR family transcriptional regulator [Facklamia languida]EHR37041.1 hypothetical protein HMPREF9708_00948 [Facklamia languida CCUG 37842]
MFQGMEYVLAVYQAQSFSKAADKLYISQPSLSANIKRIERRLGHTIFDRSTIPLKVTDFGEEYIRQALRIQQVEEDFDYFRYQYDNLEWGQLTLGGTSLFAAMILPKLMAKFNQAYPKIQLELREENSRHLIDWLHAGTIDLLLDNTPLDDSVFDHLQYATESILLAVPADFSVNQEVKDYQLPLSVIKANDQQIFDWPALPLEALEGLPFVFLKEDNDTGQRARAICHDQAFDPQITYRVDQQLTAYNISVSGMAISFIGDQLIVNNFDHDRLVYYRLASPAAQRPINFYWRKDRYLTRVTQAFLDKVQEDLSKNS